MKVKKERKKHPVLRLVLLVLLGIFVAAALVFTHFGGFGTGESADPGELARYAGGVEDIRIPENVTVVALGEASHGNAEFQQLKLTVFRHLVENYGVRALALEGDYGGCEQADRYIHGGEGSAREAAAAIGFAIYRTEDMAELIEYMRQYNADAAPGEDLRLYGIDMQRLAYSAKFLAEACGELGVDSSALEALTDGEDWTEGYDYAQRVSVITGLKGELEGKEGSEKAVHFADMLLQYCQLHTGEDADYVLLRDKFMTANALWVSARERQRGFERIFVTGHNGHVAKWGSFDQMGKLLAQELGGDYYAIGTDFYKTRCNMPSGSSGRRTQQVFYSYDPLAKAAKEAGLDICWLDFSQAAESAALEPYMSGYHYMGSLGEGFFWYMRLLPPSYRIFQQPAQLYDGMIFVANATPTEILPE